MIEFNGLTLLRLSAVLYTVLCLTERLTNRLRLRRANVRIIVRLYGRGRGRCMNNHAVVGNIVRYRLMNTPGSAMKHTPTHTTIR